MQISFNTADMDAKEGASVIALIMALWPEAGSELEKMAYGLKGDSITEKVGAVSVTRTGSLAREHAEAAVMNGYDAAAAFSPPMAEAPAPSPAEAFAPPPGVPFAGDATEADGDTGTDGSAVATAAPVSHPSSAEVDSAGLPWDARIHADTRGKNKDLTWRSRRNVDKAVVDKVTKELRKAMAAAPLASSAVGSATSPASAPAPTPAVGAPPPSPIGTTATTAAFPSEGAAPLPPASAPAAVAPPPPSVPAAPAPAAAPAPSAPAPDASPAPAPTAAGPMAEFARVMRKVTELQTAQKVTHDAHIAPALAAVGLANLRDLVNRGDLIGAFEATFDAMVAAG